LWPVFIDIQSRFPYTPFLKSKFLSKSNKSNADNPVS
jgi:hypothetical protein